MEDVLDGHLEVVCDMVHEGNNESFVHGVACGIFGILQGEMPR